MWGEQSLDCSDCGLKGRQMLGEVGLRSQEYALFGSGSEAEGDMHVAGVRSWCGRLLRRLRESVGRVPSTLKKL